MHTKSKQCATTKFPLTETLVTDMHPKAGEGKHPLCWVGNFAEGSLAEAGEGRQTSHREVVEAA